MNESDLPPLDADMRALLERGACIEPAPREVRTRVLNQIEALAVSGGSAGEALLHSREPVAAPGSARSLVQRLTPLTMGFAIGSVVGALAMRAWTPRSSAPRIVYFERAAPALPSPEPNPMPPIAASPEAAVTDPANTPAVHASPARRSSADSLAAERKLLDSARRALEQSDGVSALQISVQHERQYPSGMLVQEREALAVRALVLLGRAVDARARTERFSRRYPHSVLLPTLEAMLRATSER